MTLPPPSATTTSHRSRRARSTPHSPSAVSALLRRAATSSQYHARATAPPKARRDPSSPPRRALASPCSPPARRLRHAAFRRRALAGETRTRNSPRHVPRIRLRKECAVLHTPTRLCHHRLRRIAPRCVVLGLLVACRVLRATVDLDQDEARGVVLLLDDVEPHHPRLADAVTGVLASNSDEPIHRFRLYVNKNVDDEHAHLAGPLSSHERTRDDTGYKGSVP